MIAVIRLHIQVKLFPWTSLACPAIMQEIHPPLAVQFPMFLLRAFLATLLLAGLAAARQHVFFPTEDGAVVYAIYTEEGNAESVLAHGGRFTKESWEKQAQALLKAGFRVLAIDFRGRGSRTDPHLSLAKTELSMTCWAAVRYRAQGWRKDRNRLSGQVLAARRPPMRRSTQSPVKSTGSSC